MARAKKSGPKVGDEVVVRGTLTRVVDSPYGDGYLVTVQFPGTGQKMTMTDQHIEIVAEPA